MAKPVDLRCPICLFEGANITEHFRDLEAENKRLQMRTRRLESAALAFLNEPYSPAKKKKLQEEIVG